MVAQKNGGEYMAVKGGHKLKAFLRRARSAQARSVERVEVGFFSEARYPDGTPVTAVAAWNEFGTEQGGEVHTPERPFLRNAAADFPEITRPILREGLDPRTLVVDSPLASRVGLAQKGRIQQEITTLNDPPNAPITVQGGWMRTKTGKLIKIKGKKSSRPLIDTGFMRQSVTFRVS